VAGREHASGQVTLADSPRSRALPIGRELAVTAVPQVFGTAWFTERVGSHWQVLEALGLGAYRVFSEPLLL